jgi:hypothetical protein
MSEDLQDWIRVSDVLQRYTDYDHIPTHILERAAERGTKVHKICEGILRGIEPMLIDDEVTGYVTSFKKYIEDFPLGSDLILEKRFFNDSLLLTGQADIIDVENKVLIDIKTSQTYSKTWALQMGAYYYLASLAGLKIEKGEVVQLCKDGSHMHVYRFDNEDLDRSEELFHSAFDLYTYFK